MQKYEIDNDKAGRSNLTVRVGFIAELRYGIFYVYAS